MTEFDIASEEIATSDPGMGWQWKTILWTAGLLVAFLIARAIIGDTPSLYTEYSAVRLANGETYYGKVSGLGHKFPVMTDVFTISQKLDAASGQMGSVMVPRENEFHRPKKMILNSEQIMFIESVAAGSQVGQLIKARPR